MHDQCSAPRPAAATHRSVEVAPVAHPLRRRKHGRSPGAARSGGQFGAALTPTRGKNGAARTGPHAQPEPVRLGPAPVVRLEGPLAHQKTPRSCCERGTRGSARPPERAVHNHRDGAQPPARPGQVTTVAVKPPHGTAGRTRGSNQARRKVTRESPDRVGSACDMSHHRPSPPPPRGTAAPPRPGTTCSFPAIHSQ